MKASATFYHAGCRVCVAAEQQLADAIDPARVSGGSRRDWRVGPPQPALYCSRLLFEAAAVNAVRGVQASSFRPAPDHSAHCAPNGALMTEAG